MITDNIKALCRLNNVKISELEKELGRSKGYINHVKEDIRLSEVLKIADRFEVSLEELMNGDYPKQLNEKLKDEKIDKLKSELRELGVDVK